VRRIFRDYAAGLSSRAVAVALNAEGILGPQGRAWGPAQSTAMWSAERHPEQRVPPRPSSLEAAALPEGPRTPASASHARSGSSRKSSNCELWMTRFEARFGGRQASLRFAQREAGPNPLVSRQRPKHVFAGLARCGCCGGSYRLISKYLLGCGTARDKGVCGNRLNIRRDALEASVLNGLLRRHLMDPGLFREFCEEFTREINRLRMAETAQLESARSEVFKDRARPGPTDEADPRVR
jgi:site-specific DNA recombinase